MDIVATFKKAGIIPVIVIEDAAKVVPLAWQPLPANDSRNL